MAAGVPDEDPPDPEEEPEEEPEPVEPEPPVDELPPPTCSTCELDDLGAKNRPATTPITASKMTAISRRANGEGMNGQFQQT